MSKCGAVLNKALGHDYKTEITKPTCTEMGYTMKTCTRCGDSSKTDYTKATGHKPGDWIIDKQPLRTPKAASTRSVLSAAKSWIRSQSRKSTTAVRLTARARLLWAVIW